MGCFRVFIFLAANEAFLWPPSTISIEVFTLKRFFANPFSFSRGREPLLIKASKPVRPKVHQPLQGASSVLLPFPGRKLGTREQLSSSLTRVAPSEDLGPDNTAVPWSSRHGSLHPWASRAPATGERALMPHSGRPLLRMGSGREALGRKASHCVSGILSGTLPEVGVRSSHCVRG